MKKALIGIVAALAITGVYATFAHNRSTGPWFTDPVGSSTVSTGTPGLSEDKSNWKTYKNDAYHFSFLYPGYFLDLAEASSSERVVEVFANGKSTEQRIIPLLTMRADTGRSGDHPDLALSFAVLPIAQYGFLDKPGGRAWSYDAGNGVMRQGSLGKTGWGAWKPVAPTLEGFVWKGYQMGTGDAEFSASVVAIPLRKSSAVLEISFGRGPEAKVPIPANQILSTLKVQ